MVLARYQAYIGVLIDDLVTKGTDGEPYRMFTSRAEYRLLLREDNADLRLTGVGHRIGLATQDAYNRTERKKRDIASLIESLDDKRLSPSATSNNRLDAIGSAPIRSRTTLAQLLRRPEISFSQLTLLSPELDRVPLALGLQAEVEVKYAGYVRRQLEGVDRFRKMERVGLPEDLDYSEISGLSREVREKLTRIRPRSLGQASRISGITPAALTLLSIYLKKRRSA